VATAEPLQAELQRTLETVEEIEMAGGVLIT
jgi:hypothetical protein